jgi:hypothetical protein
MGNKPSNADNKQVRESEAFLRGQDVKRGHDGKWQPASTSPWIESLKANYHLEGLDDWDNRKVNSVCVLMGCTLHELCAWAGCSDSSSVRKWQGENRWPVYLTLQWHRLVAYKMNQPGIMAQDAIAAKMFDWTSKPAEENNEVAA